MKYIYLCSFLLFSFSNSYGQVTFQENKVIGTERWVDGPVYIDSADFDGDGDLDLITISETNHIISWFENLDEQGNFEIHTILDGLILSKVLALSDIDGDGDIDIVYAADNNHQIIWLENVDGLGNFGVSHTIATASSVKDFYFSDFDGDGDADLLVGRGTADKVVWYQNLDGLGNFGPENTITTETDNVTSVHAGDVDGDGDMDVISTSELDDKVAWYENIDGLGTFGSQNVITLTADFAVTALLVDLDGDGYLDVLSASRTDQTLAWYKNTDGLGTFGTEQIISSVADNRGPNSISAVDIDNDGDMDVVSSKYSTGSVLWFENMDGMGNFASQELITNGLTGVLTVGSGDLDGDGDLDIFSTSSNQDLVIWCENIDGEGQFSPSNHLTYPTDGAIAPRSVDMDNDGDLDVLVSLQLELKVIWLENYDSQGSFSFPPHTVMEGVNGLDTLYAEDIDGDGDMDVIAGSFFTDSVYWIENLDASGTFGLPNVITSNANGANTVIAADIDNDGDMDVLSTSNNDKKVAWYENLDGLGTFGSEIILDNNLYNADLLNVADVDTDGDLDVIAGNSYSNNATIVWYENTDGMGAFGPRTTIASGIPYLTSIHFADIDNDGDRDVFFTASYEINDGIVGWYENLDGQGNFGTQQVILSNDHWSKFVSSADVDNDGDLDIIKATNYGIKWFENTDGLGTFASQQNVSGTIPNIYNSTRGINSMLVSDVNLDGNIDVLACYDGNTVWYKNMGVTLNEISGTVRYDLNNDGSCDGADYIVANTMVSTTDGVNDYTTFTLNNGFYQIIVDEGTFETTVTNDLPYFNINPLSATSVFTELGATSTVNYCIEPQGAYNNLEVALYPLTDPRPGFNTSYQLVYKNIGTAQLNGSVSHEFDETLLQFLNSSETVSAQTSNSLTFDFINLSPFETRIINLNFNVFAPPATNIGDILASTVTINPVSGDYNEEDNVFELEETVTGSFDPNDIQVLEGDEILIEDADKYLHYIIRFQNTGTASAINVRVENELDSKLDWTTMKLESMSHTGRVEITNGTNVEFVFYNINLPDSTTDEPNSHGYIAYKIKAKDNVQLGDIFYNSADIYFDFNAAITTNTVSTEIVETLSVEESTVERNLVIYPNPVNSIFNIKIRNGAVLESVSLYNLTGKELFKHVNPTPQFDLSGYASGVYFVKIETNLGVLNKRIIKN